MMAGPGEIEKVFLKPGEFHWGGAGTEISTLLGSCVSFCFWHRRLLIGGMCHYMLPSRGSGSAGVTPEGKYGDEAIELFLKEIKKTNIKIGEFEVKLFGGANMFSTNNDTTSVPARNIEMAYLLTRKHHLNLISENTGGNKYRKLKFELNTGNVWLKRGSGAQ